MKTRVFVFIAVLAVTALGCQLITDLFNITEQPPKNPNQGPELSPQEGIPEDEEEGQGGGGALDGAGPQEDMNELIPLDHDGITIFYDPQVILDIIPETIPAGPGEFQLPYPSYTRYNLSMDYGFIELVDTYILESDHAIQSEKLWALEAILADHQTAGLNCIPELQLKHRSHICDHQQFNANLDYVDFENGYGVRFVTVYAIQDAVPVSNLDLVYVYQGVTASGDCYLKANFKISHDLLPPTDVIPDEVWSDRSGDLLQQYFADTQGLLESDPDGFFPSLEYLDRIMESIAVGVCAIG